MFGVREFEPELIKPWDVRQKSLPIPTSGVFDAPKVQICINAKWLAHVDGCLEALLQNDAWIGTEGEIYDAIQQVMQLISTFQNYQDGCGMAVITDVFADGCLIYKVIDNNEPELVIDLEDCVVPGPPGPPGEQGPPGSDATATIVRTDPAGFGNMEQDIGGVGFTDIADSDFVRRGGEFPMYGGLEISGVIDEIKLTITGAWKSDDPLNPIQNNKLVSFRDAQGTEKVWINPNGSAHFRGLPGGQTITLDGGIGFDANQRLFWKNNSGVYTQAMYCNGNVTVIKSIGTGLQFLTNGFSVLASLLDTGATTFQNQTPTTGKTSFRVKGGAGNVSADQLFLVDTNNSDVLFNLLYTGQARHIMRDGAVNGVSDVVSLEHETTSNPLAGFGVGLPFKGKSDSVPGREMGRIDMKWFEAADATRKAEIILTVRDTQPREILRGGANGAAPTIGVLGQTPSPRIDVGVIDCQGNAGTKAALDALQDFGYIDGTINLGTAPDPDPPAALLTKCQYAVATAKLMFWHFYKPYAEQLETFYTLYDVFSRTEDFLNKFDVKVDNREAFDSFSNRFWLEFGNNTDHAGYLVHIGLMQAYIENNFAELLYCFMEEDGHFTDAGFNSLLTVMEDNAALGDTASYLWDWVQSLSIINFAGFTGMASHSKYIDNCDCSGFECENWNVLMNFTVDDWADSVDLIAGNYTAGVGYVATDLATVTIEVTPFRITYCRVLFTTSDPGTQVAEIAITDLNTSVTTNYFPSLGTDFVEWIGDANLGLRIALTAPDNEDGIIQQLTLAGLGTAPAPDA